MTDQPIKILLIEDNPGDAYLIQEMLCEGGSSSDYDLSHAKKLKEGIKCLSSEKFDVVLLDLHLPDSEGLETFEKVYATVPELPVIMLTGLDDENTGIRAVSNGAQDYLIKGKINGNHLKQSIRYAIERKKRDEVRYLRILSLIQAQIEEIVETNSPDLVSEILPNINELLEIANQQNIYWLQAETYVLQSKLLLLNKDLEKARYYLIKAQTVAEEGGLHTLAIAISNDHDNLLDFVNLSTLKEGGGIIISEEDAVHYLDEQIKRMRQKQLVEIPKLPKDHPIMVLIIIGGGMTLYSKQFVSEGNLNASLIGGFLTAIDSIIREAFAISGSIERIKHKEYTLLFRRKYESLFCYIFKGQSYFAIQKLNNFTNEVITIPSIQSTVIAKKPKVHVLSESDSTSIEKSALKHFCSN